MMIVYTRLVNAEALGLIRQSRAEFHQKKCVDLVHEFIKALLKDHSEFKEEIKDYAQAKIRTVEFKI
jgi:glyoxylate carboligase